MITPTNILPDVLTVLQDAKDGDGNPMFITSYQVLERLPKPSRDQILAERPRPGAGTGAYFSADTVTAQALDMHVKRSAAEKEWLDSREFTISVGGKEVQPGNPQTALYRLKK